MKKIFAALIVTLALTGCMNSAPSTTELAHAIGTSEKIGSMQLYSVSNVVVNQRKTITDGAMHIYDVSYTATVIPTRQDLSLHLMGTMGLFGGAGALMSLDTVFGKGFTQGATAQLRTITTVQKINNVWVVTQSKHYTPNAM